MQTLNTFVAEVKCILLLPRGIQFNGCCFAACETWMISVLSFWQFIIILHRFVLMSIASIAIFISDIASYNLFPETLTVPSSAILYIAMLIQLSKNSSKSYRKHLTRIGDITCGSPYSLHVRLRHFIPFTCSCILLLFMKTSKRFINFPFTPFSHNWTAKPLFHTEL